MLDKNDCRSAAGDLHSSPQPLSTVVTSYGAQSKPLSVADLAFYQGADREKILLEGAKKEGQVTFYTSNTWVAGPVSQEFGKKYPFVKANVWRSDSKALLKRLTEEVAAGRFIADVVETSPEYIAILVRNNLLQEYLSPELAAYDDDAKIKGKTGVYAWTNREIYISLGFNTQLIPPAEAPKSIKDYLDPKWKGKMSIAGTTTGVQWVGAVMEVMGREFLDKASAQDINVQNISGAALSGLVASGEVPLSPTIFNSNIFTHKETGGTGGMAAVGSRHRRCRHFGTWSSMLLVLTPLCSFSITSIQNSARRLP